jgi:hypothetical protein
VSSLLHRTAAAIPQRPAGEPGLLAGGCLMLIMFAILPFIVLGVWP